ncbi:MAG TPA: cytochrome c [bacterium]|nr:cytochrome c [bacterium]
MKNATRIGLVAAVLLGALAVGLFGFGQAMGQGMMGWGMHRGSGMGGYGMGPGMMGRGMGWGQGYGPGNGSGSGPNAGDALRNPVPRTAASIAAGQAQFQTQCVACHGAEGLGNGPAAAGLFPHPANLQALAGTRTDGNLFTTLTYGRGAMPPFGGALSEQQRWEVVNFLQSLAH